jgi:hypothetical protein
LILNNINREHIVSAINEIDGGRRIIPFERDPHRYQLIYYGKKYPPKFIISLANKYANGQELDSSQFSGGYETNNFLNERGFDIIPMEEMSEAVRYDDMLLNHLRSTFNVDISKIKRSWLQFRNSGIMLYVNGSNHTGPTLGILDLLKALSDTFWIRIVNNAKPDWTCKNTSVFHSSSIFLIQ